MAFETIKGQKVYSSSTGQTFIFADYFTVFFSDNTIPEIYKWTDIKQIIEKPGTFIIFTSDNDYKIPFDAFSSDEQFLAVRAIIEGQISENPSIKYKSAKRILPLKYLYRPSYISDNAYFMKGFYSEKDINSCNISLTSTKYNRFILMGCLILAIIVFAVLCGSNENGKINWLLFIPISLLSATIVGVVSYLVLAVYSRTKYLRLLKSDPATSQEITIALTPQGFCAVESVNYTGCDLIPWSEASFFIETHAGLVIIRDNKSVFWLPRTFIPKEEQASILALITANVKQR